MSATFAALEKSLAIIEFTTDGMVLTANSNFLRLMDYTLAEIQGRHHCLFVAPAERESEVYHKFWDGLGRGVFRAAEFKRIGKHGKEVWIEASYNPVLGRDGKPFKVVKVATDVSARKAEYADLIGQVNAIRKSLAVIECDLDGTVRTANRNFLDAFGYTLGEVQGRHHRIFVDKAHADSPEYKKFWEQLALGEFQAARFRRIAKDGRDVWIDATYNPTLDMNGRPFKIVKYATDVTPQVRLLDNLKVMIDRNFGEIDEAVARSSGQAGLAAGAVSETSGNVQVMASSAEELAASVREIADTMAKSKSATEAAHSQTSVADQATQRLSETSRSMAGITGLIHNIAGQINLLALNATIESARAGDAGKGFAVVASEVKSLARQATDATDQISREIAGLQAVSAEVVAALAAIEASIGAVREYVVDTASAVEQQSMVTRSMAASMQDAAKTVSALNDNMTEISAAVAQVAQVVGSTKQAAQVLAR